MCPGSAVEGLRIQGSYCTLWNGLRNARCLPLLRSWPYRMSEATGFEHSNVTVDSNVSVDSNVTVDSNVSVDSKVPVVRCMCAIVPAQ